MYTLTPIIIVVWLRLDQTIERVHYLPVTHHDHPDGADTRRFLIGRLKVDGDEVSKHVLFRLKALAILAGRLTEVLGAVAAEV